MRNDAAVSGEAVLVTKEPEGPAQVYAFPTAPPQPGGTVTLERVGEIDLEGKKIRVVHHNGTAKGSSSSFMLFPDYGMTVSVMTNRGTQGGDPFHGFAREIGLLMLKADGAD